MPLLVGAANVHPVAGFGRRVTQPHGEFVGGLRGQVRLLSNTNALAELLPRAGHISGQAPGIVEPVPPSPTTAPLLPCPQLGTKTTTT